MYSARNRCEKLLKKLYPENKTDLTTGLQHNIELLSYLKLPFYQDIPNFVQNS